MNKLGWLLTGMFLVLFVSCSHGDKKKEKQPAKSQLEINRENDKRLEGDHVVDPAELPVLTPAQKQEYINRSKKAAKDAFDIFSGHLTRLFNEKKPGEALEYCHANALKITDSLSKVHGMTIKRTSYRLRNKKNKPTPQEERVMEIFRKQILHNMKPQPYFHYDNEGYPHAYIPIIVQKKFLMCHGDPNKDIPEAINEKLAELYPSDKAIFFKEGDLRGIWSMKFPRHQEK